MQPPTTVWETANLLWNRGWSRAKPDRETRPPSEMLDRQPVRLSDREIDWV